MYAEVKTIPACLLIHIYQFITVSNLNRVQKKQKQKISLAVFLLSQTVNADSLWACPGNSELSKVFDFISDDLDASFIWGIELQHPLPVQFWTENRDTSQIWATSVQRKKERDQQRFKNYDEEMTEVKSLIKYHT